MGTVDAALLGRLRERYAPAEIPRCRVCGEALSPSRMGGGGPTIFHCSSEHAKWLGPGPCKEAREKDPTHERGYKRENACEHYAHWLDSEWKLYRHGDPDVIALVEYVESSLATTL